MNYIHLLFLWEAGRARAPLCFPFLPPSRMFLTEKLKGALFHILLLSPFIFPSVSLPLFAPRLCRPRLLHISLCLHLAL